MGCAGASLFLGLRVGFAWFELAYERGFSCGVWWLWFWWLLSLVFGVVLRYCRFWFAVAVG